MTASNPIESPSGRKGRVEAKPVKAWAVSDGDILYVSLFEETAKAKASYGPFEVIPVTIIPGHDHADLILAGLGRDPMKKSPLHPAGHGGEDE